MLGELEGGPPIRRSASVDEEGAGGPATEEHLAEDLPMPELGPDATERS